MMNESHERWTDRLSDYLDGGLDETARRALEAHLAECASCRGVLEELRAVVTRAGMLGDVPPARDLWPGIGAAIGASGRGESTTVIELPTARERRRRTGVFVTAPQLAAASIALMLISAAATWWVGPGLGAGPRGADVSAAAPAASGSGAVSPAADVAGPPPELAAELRDLEAAMAAARDRLAPNTMRILEKNLGVIERAIEESRQALALDPGNAFLKEHLDRTYREKRDYLREAAGIADWTS